jgi:hypothetical protein
MGKNRNTSNVFVGNLEETRLLGRPMNTWENNIEMHIKETEQYGVDY